MNEFEKNKLISKYEQYCYNKNIDPMVFDIEAKIDSNLTFWENWNIIEEQLDVLSNKPNDIKELVKEYKAREREKREVNIDFNWNCLIDKPKIIGLCANANEGKSNLIYYFLDTLTKKYNFDVYVYGLRCNFPETKIIHSVAELEQISNSFIVVDEMFSLFDLDNRKIKSQIENTLRLIFHNNNILLLCGLGENFKKFLSAKLSVVIYKKVTFEDLINGSGVKNIIMNYSGMEKGSKVLNLYIDEAIIFDGEHYSKLEIPYMKKFDSKKENVPIFVQKKGTKSCQEVKNGRK